MDTHISQSQTQSESESELIECPICCDFITNESEKTTLECGHTFHYYCILESFKTSAFQNKYSKKRECPYCRSKGSYLELHEGQVPIRGVHKEYEFLRGSTFTINQIREKYFKPDLCQAMVFSGINKNQQCSRKPSKNDDSQFCITHSKKKTSKSQIYFPM